MFGFPVHFPPIEFQRTTSTKHHYSDNGTYHPHHDIREDRYPHSGAKKDKQVIFLPAWLIEIRESEEEKKDDWPGGEPLE